VDELADLKSTLESAEASITALTAKNKELLEEKRATKSGAERVLLEAQERIAELEGQVAKMTADHRRELEKAAADTKAAQDLAQTRAGTLGRLIRDEGLQRELLASGVKNAAHLKAAIALLREQVSVDEEKAEAFVLVKDAKGVETRKSLADFTKEWASGDEGKAFVTAPASSGGGSAGPGPGSPGGRVITMAEFNAMSARDQAKFINTGGRAEG
jgi:DNA repair exonuclease SbcCD ATPase subunit